jgi:hypothetical protein
MTGYTRSNRFPPKRLDVQRSHFPLRILLRSSRIATRKGFVRNADVAAGLIRQHGPYLTSGLRHDPSAVPRQTARSGRASADADRRAVRRHREAVVGQEPSANGRSGPAFPLARHPNPGAQRRTRIEVSSPVLRTVPSVRDPDQTNRDVPTLAKLSVPGAQRRARIEVRSPTPKTLPWKLAGDADVTVGQDPEPRNKF